MGTTYKYAIITVLATINHYVSLYGSFVFDDVEAIVKNKDVLPTSPISSVFKNDFWGTSISLNSSHKSYRPLTILTYRLNIYFSNVRLNAFHFHVTNVILYVILCNILLLTFEVLLQKAKYKDVAFWGALLYTVHPVHTESVSALVGRADVLSSILFLISFLLYRFVLIKNSLCLFTVVVFIIALAVLCKETAITAFGFLAVYDVLIALKHKKGFLAVFRQDKVLLRCSGLIVSALIIFIVRLSIMSFEGPVFTKFDNPAAFADNLLTRILSYNYVYFLNLLIFIWPEWLCFDWAMGCVPLVENFYDYRVVFVVLLWFAVISTAYLLLKQLYYSFKYDPKIAAICLMILPFIPASNIFMKVGFVIAERTLLLPSAGYCLLVSIGLQKLINRAKPNRSFTLQLCFYALCVIYTIRSIQRNLEWLSQETLFSSALNVCPLNAKVHYNVAKEAADNNKKQLALIEYNKAIELNPDYEQAMNNLANILREDKKFIEAEVLLRKALEVRPNFAAAWMNLGIVLTNLNQLEEAEYCYLKAISHRNKYPGCYYNLGNLYLDTNRSEDALEAWKTATMYRPTHTAAWSNTLVLLDSLQRYQEVLELGQTALIYNPKTASLHFNMANTLGKLRQFEKAEKHFLEALNLSPNNALYYSNLGVLYHRWGKLQKAAEMYKKALQINPEMKTTESNLRKLQNAQ